MRPSLTGESSGSLGCAGHAREERGVGFLVFFCEQRGVLDHVGHLATDIFILGGHAHLQEGDEVILSDMSDYSNRKEIRIR